MNLRLVHMNLRLVHMNLRLVHMNALGFSSNDRSQSKTRTLKGISSKTCAEPCQANKLETSAPPELGARLGDTIASHELSRIVSCDSSLAHQESFELSST